LKLLLLLLLDSLSLAERLEVINAHPRIGLNPATHKGPISVLSYREQGLDKEAQEDQTEVERVYAELARLNQEYEAKFGFRFVVFVAGRPKAMLIPILNERLKNSREEELLLGLSEMFAIASDRAQKLGISKL